MNLGCVALRVGRAGESSFNSLWTRGVAHAYMAVTISRSGNGRFISMTCSGYNRVATPWISLRDYISISKRD